MFPPNKSTTEIRALVCSLVFASHLRAGAAPSNMAVHFKWRWTSQNSPSQTQVYTDSAYRGHRAKVLQKNQPILDCHSILSLLLWNNNGNYCPKLPTPFSWQSSQHEDHKQLKSKTLPTLLWESWEIMEHDFSHQLSPEWMIPTTMRNSLGKAGLPEQGPRW